SLRKPAGSSFNKTNAVWPDPAVLEVKSGAATATVSLIESVSRIQKTLDESVRGVEPPSVKLGGRDAVVVSTSTQTQLALREGESLWVITAEGADAGALIDQIAGAWTWLSPK